MSNDNKNYKNVRCSSHRKKFGDQYFNANYLRDKVRQIKMQAGKKITEPRQFAGEEGNQEYSAGFNWRA
jgi:hypothetical protein